MPAIKVFKYCQQNVRQPTKLKEIIRQTSKMSTFYAFRKTAVFSFVTMHFWDMFFKMLHLALQEELERRSVRQYIQKNLNHQI